MLYHSYSYEDPDTGEIVDVMVDEPEYRNAGRDHRAGGPRPPMRPPGPGNAPIRPRMPGHHHGSYRERHPRPSQGSGIPSRVIVRSQGHQPTRPIPGPSPTSYDAGEYFAIRKSALAELIPAAGQVWASFLGRPEVPTAVGNDVTDRNNAALHRDALAMHQQNQTRILALTDLAARAARLFFQ